MATGDTQGTVAFTINVNDMAGNAATQRTATTNGSSVTYKKAPTVTTDAASGVTAATATLNGTVSSNGASTTVTFEYGLTVSYGETITATQSPLASNAVSAAVSADVIG